MSARGYLLDLTTNERHVFQFNFAAVEMELSAAYSAKSPHGSSHARQQYTHSEGRTLNLELMFIREQLDAEDVVEWGRVFEALPFPDYDSDGWLLRGPHVVRVSLGPWRTLRCVVKSVKVAYGPWFDPDTLKPGGLSVTLGFVETPVDGDLSHADVRGGQ